jgi:hypothetical protein
MLRAHPVRRRWAAALTCVAALAVTGCGTTVPLSARNTGGTAGLPPDSTGLAPVGATQPDGVAAAPEPGAVGPASTSPGAIGTVPAGSGPVAAGQALPTAGPSGRPTIRLGVVYLKGLEAAYKTAGASSSAVDSKAAYEAVVKSINADRAAAATLAADYVAIDASSSQSREEQLASACAHFTDDARVDIVASFTSGAAGSFAHCLARRGTPLIDGAASASVGADVLRQNPSLWTPSQLSLDRVAALQATFLSRQSWAAKRWPSDSRCATVTEPRIGVVTFDRPDWRAAYSRAMEPAFKAAGTKVYDVYYIAVEGSTAQQVSGAAAGAQSAVLKFSNDCIDHVVFLSNVAVDYLFMNIADQQGYRPRYGLSSLEAPPVIVQNVTAPGSQLHGALGAGWAPYADVNAADFDAEARRPGAACMRILAAAQMAPKDNNAAFLALPSCEGPLFALAAYTRWLQLGRQGTLTAAVDSMGTTYAAAGAMRTQLSSRQHDGASAYRGFAFVDACVCFRYSTAVTGI